MTMALHEYSEHPGIAIKKMPAEPPGNIHHDSGESDEDSLALLPRHTVVRIVGNNRTKSAYIGLQAVVKRAVGLGGWHWLVLQTGEEIKLQRNALLVLEHPTGNEQDFSEEDEEEQRRLAEQQQQRQRQLQRQQQMEALEHAGEDTRARHRRAPRPLIAEEYHTAPMVEKPRAPAVRQLHQQPRINLAKLDIEALKRYRNFYQLPEPSANTKDDLVSLVTQHFAEQTVDEAQVLSHFMKAARRHSAGAGAHYGRH